MIRTIRLFIKGELPISAPVSGFRNGAPGGSASNAITIRMPISP